MPETAALTPDLLLEHEAFVLRLARSLVRDEAGAQDVAQETLLAALRHAPAPGGLRGWLARVARHRAIDQRRGERRRGEREARAARPESQPPTPGATERLELEHGVVRAVLALEEPYRGVVVAVYYEGLTPAELARRSGVPAGTVRAQLSRALDTLRGKLDREHGDRATWGLAMVGLLRSREGVAAASSAGAVASGAALVAWPWAATGAAAACAALVVGGWWIARRPSTNSSSNALTAAAPTETALPTAVAAEAVDLRTAVDAPVDPATQTDLPAAAAATTELAELADLLARSRLLKSEILDRRLELDPALRARYAWLEAVPDAGLARLAAADPGSDGGALDLPWLHGGGLYYSFTERVHDYQRRPQVGLGKRSRELQVGFYGGYEGAVVDLGEGVFRGLALDPGSVPTGLSESQRAAWDHLHTPVEDYASADLRWLNSGLRKLGLDDDADVEPGHSYLLRAISRDEFDVLVALEVAENAAQGCTLAWRVLEQRAVPDARPVRVPAVERDDLGPTPPELRELDEVALRARLEAVRERAEELLLADIPVEVQQRFAGLAGQLDGGLTRIVERTSPFKELPRKREGGAYWSFAERSHDYDDHPDLGLEGGQFGVGFSGANTGVVVDLGELPLATALLHPDVPGLESALGIARWEEVDHGRPRADVESTLRELQERVSQLQARSAAAVRGHSYLVRSIFQGRHDLLAVFEVVDLDERGALIAWQVVRTWPVPSGR